MIDKSAPFLRTFEDIFSTEFCNEVIAEAERSGFSVAPITLKGTDYYDPTARHNERAIIRNKAIFNRIEETLSDLIPLTFNSHNFCKLNDFLRVYKYTKGMQFKPHVDNSYTDGEGESRYTVLIYLNSGAEGGETCIITEPEINITPEAGKVAMFQHGLLHEGKPVTGGAKFVLRTDIMYYKDFSDLSA